MISCEKTYTFKLSDKRVIDQNGYPEFSISDLMEILDGFVQYYKKYDKKHLGGDILADEDHPIKHVWRLQGMLEDLDSAKTIQRYKHNMCWTWVDNQETDDEDNLL